MFYPLILLSEIAYSIKNSAYKNILYIEIITNKSLIYYSNIIAS